MKAFPRRKGHWFQPQFIPFTLRSLTSYEGLPMNTQRKGGRPNVMEQGTKLVIRGSSQDLVGQIQHSLAVHGHVVTSGAQELDHTAAREGHAGVLLWTPVSTRVLSWPWVPDDPSVRAFEPSGFICIYIYIFI